MGKGWFQRYVFTPNRRTAALAVAVAVGVGIVLLIVERPPPGEWRQAMSGGEGLTVMSFNVLLGGAPSADVLDAIEAARPDILCLQELTPELAGLFKARLGKRYPHRYFKPGRMTQGVGIASRHPLGNGKLLTLGLSYLPAVSATARTDSGPIRVACIHLMPPFARFKKSVNIWKRYFRNQAIRLGQVAELLKHLDSLNMPAVIMGDMNDWPGQAAVTALAKAGFRDACHSPRSRCGPTWPGHTLSWPAIIRIDQILGRGVRFASSAVLEAGGSDHYPVAARLIP